MASHDPPICIKHGHYTYVHCPVCGGALHEAMIQRSSVIVYSCYECAFSNSHIAIHEMIVHEMETERKAGRVTGDERERTQA